MRKSIRKFSARWFGAWLLILALLLSGCTSGRENGGDNTEDPADATSDQTEDVDQPVDYSKYNAYLKVVESVSEMEGLLSSYFTVVQNQPDFALIDGMDYGMLADAFDFYMFDSYAMEDALGYCDEDPDYPEQDELLTALNEPYMTMGGVLRDITDYVQWDDYLEDNLAQAAQLHTQLYAALTAFDEAAWPFVESMDALDKATEQQELDRLKSEGMDIAYYSVILFGVADDIDAEVWAQISQAQSETLPALDMTNLETLYAQHQEAFAGLTAALADEEKVAAQWPEEGLRDSLQSYYADIANNADVALGNFMSAARSQGDYSESYDSYFSSISRLIDQYNNSI